MYLSDISRKLRMRDKELKQKMKELGFDVKSRVRTIPDDQGKKIIELIEKEREEIEAKKHAASPAPEQIEIEETVTVGELSEKLNKSAADIVSALMNNGIMANINQEIDFDTATLIADTFGTKTKLHVDQQKLDRKKGIRKRLKSEIGESESKDIKGRPPIVTIMGHVDHGKTTLLDAIRETRVVEGEAGGITQHIGAYQAKIKGKVITFLDTPGHEAFSAMRARGAKVTDVAILVVAADDGVKPQTKEALDLIKQAEVPFIVAINKMDKPDANPDRVKQELADLEVIPEDWGGDTVMVEISAKNKMNLDDLLEMILLVADVEELKANPTVEAIGTIIEQHKDPQRGVVATVLIQNGTLHIGDFVTVGKVAGTIRSMENFQAKKVDHAKPATPVQILGLNNLPEVGDILHVEKDKVRAKEKINRLKKLAKSEKRSSEDRRGVKKLNIILKSDVQGSIEAIIDALDKIKSEKVALDIIDYSVGKVTESDIMLASSSGAKIFMFRTTPSSIARVIAHEKKVEMHEYTIIYELIDKIKAYLNSLIEEERVETVIGKLEVLALFRTEKGKMIVGGKVIDGKMKPDTKAILKRDEEVVGEGKITNLQIGPTETDQVTKGKECGITFVGDQKIKEKDIVECIETTITKEVIS